MDASKKNISVAQLHSKKSGLKINYINASPEVLNDVEKFDIILNLEIVEHVENVNLYGGFIGIETTLTDRDLTLTANKTILSGDFNDDDIVTGRSTRLYAPLWLPGCQCHRHQWTPLNADLRPSCRACQ